MVEVMRGKESLLLEFAWFGVSVSGGWHDSLITFTFGEGQASSDASGVFSKEKEESLVSK